MIRNSTYSTYKGYEFKLNSNHGEYTVVIPVTGLDKEIEQILIEDGFILQAYNDPRYEDYYYKRGIAPSEVGKVYSIRTYAKYRGRDGYHVSNREIENNGVKEYEISKGWTSDEELAFGRANGFKVDDRDRSVEKWVSEDELEIYEVKKEVDNFF